jgi:chromosome segregation ATPase
MNQYLSETEDISMPKDASDINDALKSVWDKIRLAGQLIAQLRDEKRVIASRTEDLERQLTALRSDLEAKENEIRRLRAEHTQLANSNGQHGFSAEEKEAVKSRIRELISKINSYL